jgi:hypothetical protein
MAVPTAKEFFFSPTTLDAEACAAREKAFFASIRLKNGTYKTTYPHRLDDLNEIINARLPAHRPLEIMDVAASSGVATLEWMDSLSGAGIDFRMTAGDLCVRAFLLSFGRFLNVLVDDTGYPLQFDLFGRAIAYPPGPRLAARFPPLYVGIRTFRWVLPMAFAAVSKQLVGEPEGASARRLGVSCRRAALVSPRLFDRKSLTILDDNLLRAGSFENRFHVIRAANILNRSYFSNETLLVMVANLRTRLRRLGLLVVCRTHDDGINHGTLFRLNPANEFEVVSRIGDGSEIEHLVTGLHDGTGGPAKN